MSRELRRVDQSQVNGHPLGEPWPGLEMPAHLVSIPCQTCEQTGLNPASLSLEKTFYDNEGCGSRWAYDYGFAPDGQAAKKAPWRILGTTLRWCNKITQEEVNHLAAEGRLMDHTHTWSQEDGWKVREDGHIPTAQEINEAQDMSGLRSHDAINRGILVKFRASKMGVYGLCEHCHGDGELWKDEAAKAAYEEWEPEYPRQGDGWQLWETISDGSPVTPVFETAQSLIDHLVAHGDCADITMGRGGWARERATAMILPEPELATSD